MLEFAVPVSAGSITKLEEVKIERVQKTFCAIILGGEYYSYTEALIELNLERLSIRRLNLTRSFAKKSSIHPKHRNWFKIDKHEGPKTRSEKLQYRSVKSHKSVLKNGPIAYMTTLLNQKVK